MSGHAAAKRQVPCLNIWLVQRFLSPCSHPPRGRCHGTQKSLLEAGVTMPAPCCRLPETLLKHPDEYGAKGRIDADELRLEAFT